MQNYIRETSPDVLIEFRKRRFWQDLFLRGAVEYLIYKLTILPIFFFVMICLLVPSGQNEPIADWKCLIISWIYDF